MSAFLSKLSSYSLSIDVKARLATFILPSENVYTPPTRTFSQNSSTASLKKVARISVPSMSMRSTLNSLPVLFGPLSHLRMSDLLVTRALITHLFWYGFMDLIGCVRGEMDDVPPPNVDTGPDPPNLLTGGVWYCCGLCICGGGGGGGAAPRAAYAPTGDWYCCCGTTGAGLYCIGASTGCAGAGCGATAGRAAP